MHVIDQYSRDAPTQENESAALSLRPGLAAGANDTGMEAAGYRHTGTRAAPVSGGAARPGGHIYRIVASERAIKLKAERWACEDRSLVGLRLTIETAGSADVLTWM